MNREVLAMQAMANVLKRRRLTVNQGHRTVETWPGATVEIPPPQVSFKVQPAVNNIGTEPIANALAPLVEVFTANVAALEAQNAALLKMVDALIENNKRPILIQPTFAPEFRPTINAEIDSHTLIAWAREMVLNREAQVIAESGGRGKEFVIRHSDGTKSTITGG